MTADLEQSKAEAEVMRVRWLTLTTDDERYRALSYLIGYDAEAFDAARDYVERTGALR